MSAFDSVLSYLAKHPYSTASAVTAASGVAYIVWDRNRILSAYKKRFGNPEEEAAYGVETPYVPEGSIAQEQELEAQAATGTENRSKLASVSSRYVGKPIKNLQQYSKDRATAFSRQGKAMADEVKTTAATYPKTLIAVSMAFGGILGLFFYNRNYQAKPKTRSQAALDEGLKQWYQLRKSVAGWRH